MWNALYLAIDSKQSNGKNAHVVLYHCNTIRFDFNEMIPTFADQLVQSNGQSILLIKYSLFYDKHAGQYKFS